MFTGIVSDIATIDSVKELASGKLFRIRTAYDTQTIDIGASIACAGVCLTVTAKSSPDSNNIWFEVEAWEEALRLTSAATWVEGTRINTERAMKVGDEYGGHMVSGHVDGLATVTRIEAEGDATRFYLEAPSALSKYIAPKGSVCLDGTSLTVNSVNGDIFDVLLIRHSQKVTTWGQVQVGDKVNIEIDQIARYVERYISRLAEAGKEA
ncbi:riboflavin synthase [Ahrensia kielensis]|uniref:Riboflavin synthase n=1 Tax=Ahrensia kielensis TaxID=76980 RepID=A0ABU9T471_9HYPH